MRIYQIIVSEAKSFFIIVFVVRSEEKVMQFIYPAVFCQKEDGTYHGYFPDLEQCFARGDTLDEVLNNAIEEARTWIQVELEDTFELPGVTPLEDLILKEGEFIRNIAVTIRLTDGWDE